MSVAKKIFGNTLAQFCGKLVVGVMGIITIKILTSYLSIAGYGEYAFIYDFLAFFGILADLGLYTIGVREMSKDETKIPKILGNILSIRTLLGCLVVVIAFGVSFIIPIFKPEYEGLRIHLGVLLGACTVLFALINGTLTTVLQAHLRMQQASLAMIIGRFFALLYMLYVVFIAYTQDIQTGFYHLIAAGVIGNIVMIGVTTYYVRKLTVIRYRFDVQYWKEVLAKSIPFGIALILNTIYFRLNTVLLFFLQDSEQVAIYSIGMRLIGELTIVSLYFMNAVLPVLTKSISEKDGRHRSIIQYSFEFLTMVSLPLVAGGIVLAYPLVAVISQPEYLSRFAEGFFGSDISLQILLVAFLFSYVTVLMSFILVAIDEQKKLLWINLGSIAINLAMNLYFIPRFGAAGAAMTSIFAELYLICMSYRIALRHLDFSIQLNNVLKAIVAAVIMGGVIFALRDWTYTLMENKNLLLLIPLGGALYIILLFATKAVPKEVIDILRPKTRSPEQVEGIG